MAPCIVILFIGDYLLWLDSRTSKWTACAAFRSSAAAGSSGDAHTGIIRVALAVVETLPG
jgi:hypothetical protein